mgnify:CR=1 FL=1
MHIIVDIHKQVEKHFVFSVISKSGTLISRKDLIGNSLEEVLINDGFECMNYNLFSIIYF